MALTPEQIKAAREKYGISVPDQEQAAVQSRVQSLDEAWGAPQEEGAISKFAKAAGTAIKDVAVGGAKGLARAIPETIDIANRVGVNTLAAIDPTRTANDIYAEQQASAERLGVKPAIDEVQKQMDTNLAYDNNTQAVAGFGAQIVAPFAKGAAVKALKGVEEAATAARATRAAAAAEKEAATALESVTPKVAELTPTEYGDLLRQQKVTPKTPGKPAQYIPSAEEKAVATKYKALLQDKDPVANSINVMTEIVNKDAEVGQFLAKNNGIFSKKELTNYISERIGDIKDISVADTKLAKLKTQITNDFMKTLKKKDMVSLWESRKMFDKRIEDAFAGSQTLQKEMKRAFRNAVQEFISERTPDLVYKGKMKDMKELFDLQDILATKATKERGLSAYEAWIKANPNKVNLLKGAAGVAGLTGLYGLVF